MAKVSAFLAPGLEEVECLAVVDVLRRAGVCVDLVSISEDRCVTGSHGICIVADTLLGETDFEDTDCLFLIFIRVIEDFARVVHHSDIFGFESLHTVGCQIDNALDFLFG